MLLHVGHELLVGGDALGVDYLEAERLTVLLDDAVAVAIRPAGLLQQSTRAFQVERVRILDGLRVVCTGEDRLGADRHLAQPEEDALDDRFAIEGLKQRLADLLLLEDGGLLRVEVVGVVTEVEGVEAGDGHPFGGLEALDLSRRHVVVEVKVAGPERLDEGRLVREDLHGEAIEDGHPAGHGVPVLVVALDRGVVPLDPLDEAEGAGADDAAWVLAGAARVLGPLGGRDAFPDVAGDDRENEVEEEGGADSGRLDLERVLVDHAVAVDRLIDGGGVLAAGLRVELRGEAELDVGGAEVGAVVPLGVLVQVEGVGHAVGAALPAVGKARGGLAVHWVGPGQAFEDEPKERVRRLVRAQHHVDGADVRELSPEDLAALGGGLLHRVGLERLLGHFFAGGGGDHLVRAGAPTHRRGRGACPRRRERTCRR
ncbi:MAG: hypothetical protein AVDCRST_MAG19-47 [uncultured Thermomicrobiales bacterium]|uniref:Uncharacterized protein n=1 Tax=uncultured Thermomicrobiales bacterium TaxID=1645740 RepID=A0A6J4UA89_9BACT|nr:MAG: hypothetical protein AVDCRST_MAG19-47 [uncultured Thermomicrobiales bacterium]